MPVVSWVAFVDGVAVDLFVAGLMVLAVYVPFVLVRDAVRRDGLSWRVWTWSLAAMALVVVLASGVLADGPCIARDPLFADCLDTAGGAGGRSGVVRMRAAALVVAGILAGGLTGWRGPRARVAGRRPRQAMHHGARDLGK